MLACLANDAWVVQSGIVSNSSVSFSGHSKFLVLSFACRVMKPSMSRSMPFKLSWPRTVH